MSENQSNLSDALDHVFEVGMSHGLPGADSRGRVNDQKALQKIDRQGSR